MANGLARVPVTAAFMPSYALRISLFGARQLAAAFWEAACRRRFAPLPSAARAGHPLLRGLWLILRCALLERQRQAALTRAAACCRTPRDRSRDRSEKPLTGLLPAS